MVAPNAITAAVISTGLISLAPNVLLVLFPRYASGEGVHSSSLALGQALAAGALLGDVFLHTIPHAAGVENVGLWILFGFFIFLVVDMVIRSYGSHQHQHQHHHGGGDKDGTKKNYDTKSDHMHDHKNTTSTILLNLAADALHNFTDGLAIGASFASVADDHSSVATLLQSRGGLATLSILFHEIPHELGDFAILVKNGLSRNKAILCQFGTAVAAMIGTFVGLFLQSFAGDSLMFVTAGGFVYLAAVSILPEILEDSSSTLKFRLLQLLCFAGGIAFLYSTTILEEMSGHHSHGHHDHHDGHSNDHGHNDHHDHHSDNHHDHHDHGHQHGEL
ncbi:unnamed protein product [Cylindrotheca closterium]|uniref:Uncharacterized protein n=1 Tax=Cylindrotheca closterium TaxID=2856 RepID=A0AAD2PUB7_9STRA|nr:unnamed protein product [Cylindrotheca closterium]